jgi:hypothetical protein
MIKLKLYPPSGTIEDASALKFELSGVVSEHIRVHVENATHGTSGFVTSLQDMGDGTHMGIANIKIHQHFQQSAISIFAYIEEQQEDGSYKTIQICPTIFTIKNKVEEVSSRMSVSPSFVGQGDLCSIRIGGKPDSKVVVAVNDKFFKTIINDEGLGSVSFKGSDVIGQNDFETVHQLPIYLYNEENNFTKKVFSDHYLNILPSSLSMHLSSERDPRCDETGPWVMPTECIPIIEPPDPCNPEIEPKVPGVEIPTQCRQEKVRINESLTCKIFSHSATLLNNGMVIHAYLSPDLTVVDSDDPLFNINKLFLAKQHTSLDVQILANRDVVVEPKVSGENFIIHVQEDVWQAMDRAGNPSGVATYVVLFNEAIGFQRIQIIDRGIDPYTGSFTVTGVSPGGDTLTIRDWLFCVNAVFFNSEESDLNFDVYAKPLDVSAFTVNDIPIQMIDVKVASNSKYVGEDEESYIYIIASALVGSNTQLFFNSFVIGKDSSVPIESAGWSQLTFAGNNQNPVCHIGTDNNLHIVWESDRGGIKQLYYGTLGLSDASAICTAFSSSIDKYSDFLSKNSTSFASLDANLLTSIGADKYNPSNQVPEFSSEDLVSSNWIEYGSGSIVQSSGEGYINDLTIQANALTEDALAFNSLQIVDDADSLSDYTQFNYQISFEMDAIVAQSSRLATAYEGIVVSDKEMNIIFDEWKNEFILSIDDNVENQPAYVKNSNSFVIGRVDNIFDRIIPIVGSYQNEFLNPSGGNFQIDITEQSNNLKDFTFGLMFEKSRFVATNIYSVSEFPDNNPSGSQYVASETQTIYTGMAKLVAFIKTEDTESDRANYIIVREFPEKIDVTDNKTYTIISNYTRLDSPEVTTLLDTYDQTYINKFLGQVTLLIDDLARFSQSFISTITNDYNYFDIGFGIPYGGYYIADKMSPSKLGVFDNATVTMEFTNIDITSPTYTHNTGIVNIPSHIRDMTRFRVYDTNPSFFAPNDLLTLNMVRDSGSTSFSIYRGILGEDHSELFNTSLVDTVTISFTTWVARDKIVVTKENGTVLYDSGFIETSVGGILIFDVDVSNIDSIYINTTRESGGAYQYEVEFKDITYNTVFTQIPITFEGINQSTDMELGTCNDVHLAWQSNRDKNWNIFYSSSVDKLSPFRFDTRITNTESNSLRPSVSVNRNGSRLITWHDDRNGNYDIFMARATDGYDCDQDKCKKEMADAFDYNINECDISIDYESIAGTYSLSLQFYKDAALSKLYTTISVDDTTEDRWFVDGSQALIYYDTGRIARGVIFSTDGDVIISYSPDKDDGIFDIVLYVKLVATEIA